MYDEWITGCFDESDDNGEFFKEDYLDFRVRSLNSSFEN